MSAAPASTNGSHGLADAAKVLELLDSSVPAADDHGGSRPGTEEALQRAAAILTTDLRVELLLELPGLADTQQELRAQWQAVGLLLVRILRSAPSLLTPAAHELLDSVQMLALGLGPTSGAPNRLDNLPILQEAAPLLVRLAQEPQGDDARKQLQSLALVYWHGPRAGLLTRPGPLRSQFRGDPYIRNAMRLAVLGSLHSTAQQAPEKSFPLLAAVPEAVIGAAWAEAAADCGARAAPSTLNSALESFRLLYCLYQGEDEHGEEFREAYSQIFNLLRSSESQLRSLELLTQTSSVRLVAAEEHLAAWMDRLVGVSELLLSMAAELDAAPALSAVAVLTLREMVNMVQVIMRHIEEMSGAPGTSADTPDPSRWLRKRCLGAARALLKLPAAMLALQHGLAGAIASVSACNSTGRHTKMLGEWEEMRQELHPGFSAEVVGFAASLYFTLWDTTGLNELESAEMRSAHARMKALGGTASEFTGWVETCLGFEEIPREQRSLEDRFAQREEELPADAAVRLHRKLVARQQQAQKQQKQLSEAELKAKEEAAMAAAEALLREVEEAEARQQQQSAGKAAKNKAKRERQKQQRKQEQQQAAEAAKQAAEQAKRAQLPEQPDQQQQQQQPKLEEPPSPAQAEQSQPWQHQGAKSKDSSVPVQAAASPPQAAAQPSASQPLIPGASSLANGAAPAAAAPPNEQLAATLGREETETDEDAEFLMMLAQLGVQEPSLETLAADPLLLPPQQPLQPWPAAKQTAAGPAAGLAAAVAAAAAPKGHSGGHSAAPVDDADECVVCMSSARQAVLVPCGHLVLCTACAQHLFEWHKGRGDAQPQCPFCRAQVVHYVPLKP